MKKRMISFAAVACCCFAVAFAKDVKTVVLTTAPEMHCSNCENKIKSNIRFEKGVKEIETNLENKTVTVKYDADKTTVDNIIAGFAKIDFKAAVAPEGGSCCGEKKADGCACGGDCAEKKDGASCCGGKEGGCACSAAAETQTSGCACSGAAAATEKKEGGCGCGCGGACGAAKETAATGDAVVYFKAVQMHCGGCAAKVEKTLAAVDGVKSATVDLPTKSVKVTYDADKLDVNKLKATFTGSLKYSSQLYYPDDAKVSYASFLAEGMHCGGCAAKVKKNMLAEAGVKDVTVCLDTKAVGIAYDSSVTDVSKLIDGFKKMNYEVTECYNN